MLEVRPTNCGSGTLCELAIKTTFLVCFTGTAIAVLAAAGATWWMAGSGGLLALPPAVMGGIACVVAGVCGVDEFKAWKRSEDSPCIGASASYVYSQLPTKVKEYMETPAGKAAATAEKEKLADSDTPDTLKERAHSEESKLPPAL